MLLLVLAIWMTVSRDSLLMTFGHTTTDPLRSDVTSAFATAVVMTTPAKTPQRLHTPRFPSALPIACLLSWRRGIHTLPCRRATTILSEIFTLVPKPSCTPPRVGRERASDTETLYACQAEKGFAAMSDDRRSWRDVAASFPLPFSTSAPPDVSPLRPLGQLTLTLTRAL